MARRVKQQAITAKMYRHFATLTIAVTAAVAVFADGENREAIATEVSSAPRPAPSAGPSELARKDSGSRGSFASEGGYDGAFGQPMDTVGAAPHDGIIPNDFASATPAGVPAGYNRYGISAEEWASLTEEQKKELIARHEA